ncbi:MAG: exodeoxyribonuclease VII small subunit [Phycisphaerae bacterium]|nr:exodeoxyribonuclease VII small subunit [Phycisphaerae bacterium]
MTEKEIKFENALEELEKIVSQIEAGEVSLEESIESYAQGMKLVKQCRTILETAEKKIQLLAKSETNTNALTPDGELANEAE